MKGDTRSVGRASRSGSVRDDREVLERLLAQPAPEDGALLARMLADPIPPRPAGYAAPVLRPQGQPACAPAPRLWPAAWLARRPLQAAGAALLAGAVALGGSATVALAVPARYAAATTVEAPAGRGAAAALSRSAPARAAAPARSAPAAPRAAPKAIPAFELAAAPPAAAAPRPAPAPLAAPPAAMPQYAVLRLPELSLAAQMQPPPPPPPPGVEIYNPIPVEIYNPPAPAPAPRPQPARPAPRPQPARPAPRPSTAYPTQGAPYVVQRGDYLRLISTWSYGTERLWPVIYDSNLRVIGANPDLIYPGQRLSIPVVSGRPQPRPAARTYTVRPGDTLAAIALRVYGDAGRWPQLYRANAAAIGAQPGLIFPGTVLALP